MSNEQRAMSSEQLHDEFHCRFFPPMSSLMAAREPLKRAVKMISEQTRL